MRKAASTDGRRIRWQRRDNGRYYEAHLARDLFGDWVLTRVWGRRDSAQGRVTHTPCDSYSQACKLLGQVTARRQARGYTQVTNH